MRGEERELEGSEPHGQEKLLFFSVQANEIYLLVFPSKCKVYLAFKEVFLEGCTAHMNVYYRGIVS